MSRYKVTINTDSYICQKCSKKNWEAGTMNDFMIALNGWKSTENSLKEVRWRLNLFSGRGWSDKEWDTENCCLKKDYEKWRNKKCNEITYLDRLCGFNRKHEIRGYGFTQGYFDIDEAIEELKQKGETKIPFKWLYDLRQYYKGMNGCYMEIKKA